MPSAVTATSPAAFTTAPPLISAVTLSFTEPTSIAPEMPTAPTATPIT